MIEFEIDGYLYFTGEWQLRLEDDLVYQVPSDLLVTIRNGPEDNRLDISLKVLADDKDSAVIRAENELERISNLVSWFYDVPITNWKINRIWEKKGSQIWRIHSLPVSAIPSKVKTLGEREIENLKRGLTKNYPDDFEEILMMWRQALTEESKGLKFFLFYRILEKLCGDRSRVDEFVRSQINNVKEMDNRQGRKVTIFTYLRDNIHPKRPEFPYREIGQCLPQPQHLVRKKIEEVFSPY